MILMIPGAILITRPCLLSPVGIGIDEKSNVSNDNNDHPHQRSNDKHIYYSNEYDDPQRVLHGYLFALIGSVFASFSWLLVALSEDIPWTFWIALTAPVGAVLSPFVLYLVNGFQLPYLADDVTIKAIFFSLVLLVGVLNVLAQLLTVLAVQVTFEDAQSVFQGLQLYHAL